MTTAANPLYGASQTCEQGLAYDQQWKCTNTNISHEICGHRGTLAWKSPTYHISENAGYIPVTLVRTGGGFGAFEVSYALVHEGTNRSDVSHAASYVLGLFIISLVMISWFVSSSIW